MSDLPLAVTVAEAAWLCLAGFVVGAFVGILIADIAGALDRDR